MVAFFFCLRAAVVNGQTKCVELLLQHPGWQVLLEIDVGFHKAARRGHNLILSALIKDNISFGSRNFRGCAALYKTISHAQHETVNCVLEMRALCIYKGWFRCSLAMALLVSQEWMQGVC